MSGEEKGDVGSGAGGGGGLPRDFSGVLFGVFGLVCLGVIGVVFANFAGVAAYFAGCLSPLWFDVVFTLVLAAVAGALFLIRARYPIHYAIMELMFGLASAWVAVQMIYVDRAQWAVVVGALYLLVRGCDNLEKGLVKRKEGRAG
jgi:hypothetical protein